MRNATYRQISNADLFGRVAVLLGGTSAEREISLLSGQAVYAALVDRGVDAHTVDATGDYINALMDGGFDRVWIALHGRGGEDGTVQGLLEMLGMPYTGSGVLGSALAMDKLRTKQLLQGVGIATPAWRQIEDESQCAAVAAELGCPMIVKPALEGSSIGMSKVDRAVDLPAAWRKAAESGTAVFAEAWVSGPEYTAAILHNEVLPLIKIDAHNTFYDYEAKYFSDETLYICPCDLPAVQEQELAALALDAFRVAGGAGWGRVDFMLDEVSGEAQVLELNTVPGMTSHSLVPMAAQQAGIDFGGLVWRILETSFVTRNLGGISEIKADQEKDDAA
ncbi:MAG: D-alanine--D-alanine ligase [Gammaproteobacteria bacterium]|nr:MAG: D-alanine--D-alanine ligase [Gammaproteobacteria bacterium]